MTGNEHPPPEALDPYPSERAGGTPETLQCTVCGETFDVINVPDDGAELVDASAFLRRHRRCVRRLLNYGGVMAKPAPARPGRRRT